MSRKDADVDFQLGKYTVADSSAHVPVDSLIAARSEQDKEPEQEAEEATAENEPVDILLTPLEKSLLKRTKPKEAVAEQLTNLASTKRHFSEICPTLNNNTKMVCKIYLLDWKFYEISYNDATTVSDAVQEVARSIKLSTCSGFGLFRFQNVKVCGNGEYIPLHENSKMTDVLAELNVKDKLFFKIRVFRDEAMRDPVFLHMSFVQLRHDYLCGNYSALSREDVEQLSSLLILIDIGFHANAKSLTNWYKILNRSKPQYLNRKYCKDGLKHNIENCYLSLKTRNKEDAMHAFMSILSKLPYGKSIFYNAKKIIGDPKCIDVIVGVNKVGVHLFGVDQHRHLLNSILMKDIRRYGSSKTRFILELRDDGLEFETKLAEEMFLTLNTHVQDSMEGTKASSTAAATADSDVSQPASVSNINLDSRDEAFKQRGDADKEVGILRGELQQVREDHERQLQKLREDHERQLQKLTSELARFKENISCTVAELDKLSIKTCDLEETCSSQRGQLSVLEHQLAAANQKLKMADLSSSEIRTEYEDQKRIVADLQDRLRETENQLLEGDKFRKKLHNTILELKGNIRVFCRVTPLLPDDGPGAELTVSYPTSVELAGRGIDLIQSGQKYPFTFDKVFAHDASQQAVFMEISELVQSALDGYKVCIFAYGQTGSGKTYTMVGNFEAPGLIQRSLEQVFQTSQALAAAQGWKYKIQASMLEIYNENIQDLLASKSNAGKGGGKQQHQYKISHDAEGNTTVADLTIIDVSTMGQVSNLLQKAAHRRSVGRTDMNAESSRSHLVFTLRIYSVHESTEQQVQGVLNLIDLAGSERLSRSGATGDRLKERQAINKSLSSLSDVIFALAKKEDHVPFRNSKLTYLLQPCLSGGSKTLMLVNVSPDPSSIGESLCSLRFAARVNSCEIGIPRRQRV